MSNELHHALEPEVTASKQGGILVTYGSATIGRGHWPMRIPIGGSWLQYVTWFSAPNQPQDLSAGYTASFVVTSRPGGLVLLTMTQADGITLGASQPNITLTRSAVQTAALLWAPMSWYALSVTHTVSGLVYALLSGPIAVVR